MNRPVSSLRASRRSRSGRMWIRPVIRNGGIEMSACSGTLGVRRSGRGSTVVSATAKRTAPRLTCAYSDRTAVDRAPYSSTIVSDSTRKSSSAWLRMSLIRCWRVRTTPRITNASVYRVSWTTFGSPRSSIDSNMPDRIRGPDGPISRRGDARAPQVSASGACGHQLLGTLLEALVQDPDRLERVDLVDRLVRPKIRDPREAERVARLVPARADDDVERDLDHDGGLHLPVAPV